MRIRDYSTVTANPRRQLISTPEVDAVDQIVECDLFKLKLFKWRAVRELTYFY
jgi:hypothetical protein